MQKGCPEAIGFLQIGKFGYVFHGAGYLFFTKALSPKKES
ncbi:hypothetical protein KIS4809_1237 [Bacillus sp. ZZV12-4809]|nr:hypothetical protein KIS4809_1237 [Bacillus sp. ZZV12-4809]